MTKQFGPKLPISQEIHQSKYRLENETFEDCVYRQVSNLGDNEQHRKAFRDILLDMRFMPAGRIQAAIGSPREVTPINCFVSSTINDSFNDIMDKAKEAGLTMRVGGGIGYNFSTLRPRGERIKSQGSYSSGPVSFMNIFDSICGTVASAGHRRGAQMGILRVDHPDIMEFIHAKRNSTQLTRFNISVGVTDQFMEHLKQGKPFNLKWRGRKYDTVDPEEIWNAIMRSTWDWAEPGVFFIDRANEMNNLWYAEEIIASNPCGEQPLPSNGACLLGSFNLTKYVDLEKGRFDFGKLMEDIPPVVRAMDNVIDIGPYPLVKQEEEEKNKRRMGLGLTGMANAIEALGYPYASPGFIEMANEIMKTLTYGAYMASVELAREKGPFPLFDAERYLQSKFIQQLPHHIQQDIAKYGIRNSHLTSIAPTGTISLSADNISSGIEPVFTHSYTRTIETFDGPINEHVTDYAYREWGVEGRTAMDIPVEEHVDVLTNMQQFVDSACSKTCNVGDDVTWERFKDVYMRAYEGGAKGCTTFRPSGKRFGILQSNDDNQETVDDEDSLSCHFDPVTGQPSCS